ncbi:MAG: hypothetical protein OEV85_05685 [Candidatus Thorarchaeota archaeon]|nr:hypothetical protein [Candidatus Thorarchaeota archaeon]
MIHCLYIVTSDGESLYGKSFEEDSRIDTKTLPAFVRNSVVLFHSRSSTSSERVYTLEYEESVWAYAFFQSLVLVARTSQGQHISPMKNMMLALGRSLMSQYGDTIRSWTGSMSEIIDLDSLIDDYISVSFTNPSESLLDAISQLLDSAMERQEISFVGVFDSSGKMLRGNFPESHLFRLEVEISRGAIKPVMDIVPTSVSSGEHKVQMFQVKTLTIAVAADPLESDMHAVSMVGELAYSLNELLSG